MDEEIKNFLIFSKGRTYLFQAASPRVSHASTSQLTFVFTINFQTNRLRTRTFKTTPKNILIYQEATH